MTPEERIIRFDQGLKIEAYRFKGVMQKFPNHFHEHYVIGFIEKGQRRLSYKNSDYLVGAGDILLFNPLDNHHCEQLDDQTLDYRCLNINIEIMKKITTEITVTCFLPHFTTPVAYRSEQVILLQELHQMIMAEREDFEKEERFYFLMEQLIDNYSDPPVISEREPLNDRIDEICQYIEDHYHLPITLDNLAGLSGMNKFSLLRTFTRIKGITPYCYLENIRINAAKKLLEQGSEPVTAAVATGFSDQSHFSRFFKRFIGLTPGQYRDIFIRKGHR